MNDFFGKNLSWKIFSLILAIGLWFIVINVKNPEQTMSFVIPVKIENMDKVTSRYDLLVTNLDEIENKTIQLNIRGTRLTLEQLKSNKRYLDEITATADLELFRYTTASEVNKIPIEVSFSDEYRGLIFEERNQLRYLDVVLEKKKSVKKPIQVETVGQTQDGYVILEPKVNPNQITLVGAESLINQVTSVRVSVNINDVSKDKNISGIEPKVYDAQGKEIVGLDKNIDSVSVNVGVGKKRKVILQPKIQGTYADGYIRTGLKIEPEEIVVVGNESTIDNLSQINLSTIIFDNLNETTVFRPDIMLPSGVTRWDSTDSKVSVTVEVKRQIVKKFKVSTSRLTLRTEKQFKYISKEVTVSLQGVEDEINKINENMLLGSIDVSGYGEGRHEVPVKFNIPNNIKQVGDPPTVEIELIASEEEPKPQSQTGSQAGQEQVPQDESTNNGDVEEDNVP